MYKSNIYVKYLICDSKNRSIIPIIKGSSRLKDRNSLNISKTRLIRLIYYNDFLLKESVITNREHQRMNNAIISKYGNECGETKDRFTYQRSFPSENNGVV